jgi:predicted ATPase
MLTTLAVANYRSLRDLVIPLGPLNVVTGANGSGKSNLYRALRLLAQTAQGGVTASLAREGGLDSALWAGPESFSRGMKKGDVPVQGGPRRAPVSLRLGFTGSEFGYAIDLGLPPPRETSAFNQDPEIKRECIWAAPVFRPASLLLDRRSALVRVRTESGGWDEVSRDLARFDSVLARLTDPQRTPEVIALRDQIRSWRFYDHFRTDADAPARQTQIGTYTPVLDDDGRDLAAALQTIREIGDAEALDEAVGDAFPGTTLSIRHDRGRFEIELRQHGLLRSLSAAELSDGTLRYLLLMAVMLTPRPPELMVFNEPETSLHPDLLPALARLIAKASVRSQVWVVSHSPGLIASLEKQKGCNSIVLEKQLGETTFNGSGMLDKPSWSWPGR